MLIGSLGSAPTGHDGGQPWFPIGSGPTVVTGPGELFLAENGPSFDRYSDLCGFGPTEGCFGTTDGSLTVTITPNSAVPTSKDQCKNGGWQNLSDTSGTNFKNQGECVSYVAAGGKK